MTWMRYTAGRLKSDYRYSVGIVYNNYPWPTDAADEQIKLVEKAAQEVLNARALYPKSTPADLYDPRTTPPELVWSHHKLDRAVDKCYRSQPFTTEIKRMEHLFKLYERMIEKQKYL
ncbi:MAG: hypothetical protein DHS20C01_34460 [marine bacterium B5-7]|nr:MAG: hypothetical protein DHS20C01_34460 [marine bacterium B5-7]